MSAPAKKSERTRLRIREAAFELFGARGYEGTTMRAIAAKAGCALGLIYRYFPRREDLVTELYRDLEHDTRAAWAAIGEGTLAERIEAALLLKVALVLPHREAFRAIAGAVLEPDSVVGLFSAATTAIRDAARESFRVLLTGASDAPKPSEIEPLVEALFVAQLAVLLAATQDPHPDGRTTRALVKTIGELLRTYRPILPFAAPILAKLAAHVVAYERRESE